ncbi:DUF898 family protein [Gilvimarinus sp. SDUM040013]|uniref:DUF898 family protein n=1 Tax=Gilvimarinus gilvus TaxID=3058038 RepID=A0ABU4S3F6_9GAMM|nr:DUF898 family protein [Gilvimarinus sp. SDUM040013]MDO3386076.1 DUF898 family protein [Gilvimarinus sp. SDUM040013]MDX6850383.1 DUF898 family protein [Gilvimarinus sp. SDUM040013]
MQEQPTYKIVLLGARAGVIDVQAQAGFAKLFKLPPDKVEKIFSERRRVLKTGLSQDQANKYVERLSEVGVACEIVEEVPEPVAPPETAASAIETDAEGTPPPPQTNAHDAQDDGEAREVAFEFTGDGFEYFKIWIVNILLSIVTLGIYSAWAKVRNKQYFYGNTYLDDASFEYSADPIKILIGRAIAFVFLVFYTVSGQISIVVGLITGLLFMVAVPWVICKSMRFNARYSSYRNVRFTFNGRLGDAALAFILWPILGMLTIGILIPYAIFQQKKFIYANHGYGTQQFEFSATAGQYYVAILLAIAIYVGAAITLLIPFIGPLIALVIYLYGFAYIVTALANINYNAITLGNHALSANWDAKEYLILVAVNSLLTVLTLGLFIPWAKVRTARYKARFTQAVFVGNFDTMVEHEKEAVNALAESVGDLFDIEIGF